MVKSHIRYLEPDNLRDIMHDESLKAGKDYVVVDVRDSDRIGGHILNSINVPAHEIKERADLLVAQNQGIGKVIFHCALSQVRGPKSARIYNDALNLTGNENGQEVYVLRGGFTEFQRFYRDDAKLVDAFNKELWDL
ncbi:Rhodanese-like protein [Conidiobolus coronatus NRRL 28638]|uniref:Rhodanese-like protein n=1 Tax=Conidiobolus coronatus (strain ATCC 28846 / CBS 209.66 / NRRL 28638) TaxID=796925 RepID=A0A137P837_CONC2|nr:Rhodanese-like protein [Conidiobolus coronatus NRRL 28638]|eukprot:KXN71168.1 Rhodanese-like protein [Conidiobolus coronatus NRRL 28638]